MYEESMSSKVMVYLGIIAGAIAIISLIGHLIFTAYVSKNEHLYKEFKESNTITGKVVDSEVIDRDRSKYTITVDTGKENKMVNVYEDETYQNNVKGNDVKLAYIEDNKDGKSKVIYDIKEYGYPKNQKEFLEHADLIS